MDADEIIYRLKKLSLTQRDLADRYGVAHSTVNNVLHDRITCFRIASLIATELGQTADKLWPNRYRFKPRKPKRAIGTAKRSKKSGVVKKGEADPSTQSEGTD